MFQIEIIGEDKIKTCVIPEKLDQACRLCLEENGTVDIFHGKNNKIKGKKISELLSALNLLSVKENDDLPNKICGVCSALLYEFYLFKEQIKTSQVILNVALGKVDNQIVAKSDKNIEISENNVEFLPLEIKCEEVEVKEEIEVGSAENEILDEQTYVCTNCGRTFNDRKSYMGHKRHRNCIKIPCDLCNKLIVQARIKDHMNTHTKERPHTCDVCGKSFHSAPNLYTHKFVHKEIRPHVCNECGKSYKHAAQLRDHIRKHNPADNFVCDECGLAFATYAAFKTHQMKHKPKQNETDEKTGLKSLLKPPHLNKKSYFCDTCQKEYSTSQRLAVHMRVHTGERPFKCEFCNKKFTQRSHLVYHKRLHTGEKPYGCEFCGKRFAVNGNLQQHIQTHTGERPHPCDLCEKTFYTNSSLKKHRRIHEKIYSVGSETD